MNWSNQLPYLCFEENLDFFHPVLSVICFFKNNPHTKSVYFIARFKQSSIGVSIGSDILAFYFSMIVPRATVTGL